MHERMHKMLFVGTLATLAMLSALKADAVDPSAHVDETRDSPTHTRRTATR
jgi:hypothetical protein